MGDFSRDTFKLTNVMHQLLTGETVTNPRHYVGVRLQQGVPVLDADWNELEDIRRAEVQALLNFFIGSGVPANNQGFEISGSGADDDFTIGAGIILVAGMIVINSAVTTYSGQPEAASLPNLNPPTGGVDRTDLVYLDVWDEEVGANGGHYDDERLVNAQVGVETARRLARHWAVRVEEGEQDLANVTQVEGHHYTALALIERSSSTAVIYDYMVVDLRKTGITLSDHLKVPIYVRRGIETIDAQRFVNMLNALRTTLFDRLKDNTLPYQTAPPDEQRKEALIFMSLQQMMHLCQVGENQAVAGSLDNGDALAFMSQLYGAQDSWLDILEELGNDASVAQGFIDEYQDYLGISGGSDSLKPALDDNDLIKAVIAQEELNTWLAATGDNLPEGSVDAFYVLTVPYENLTAGSIYEFRYEISANFTSPQTSEEFQVQVNLNSAFGTVSVDQSTLTFAPPEGQATITVTVKVSSGGLSTADLDVVVFASRNPLIVRSTQMPITLKLNELPPVAAFYFYAGSLSPIDRRFEIPQNHLTRSQGRNVLFKLRNDSATERRTYEVQGQIVPKIANTTGWSPLTLTPITGSPITLSPKSETDVLVNIRANNPANIPSVGTTGKIISTAKLIKVNGSPVSEPQEPIKVTVPFVVDNPTS